MPIIHSLSATTPDNPAYEIKPSNWNQSHVVSLVGSEVLAALSNSPSVTFGLSNGFLTASAAGGGGAGNLALSAGSTSQTLTGITFSNSNGISFGLNAGTITASYSNQTEGYYAIGNTTLASSGTMDARSQTFSAAGLVSIGVSNGSIIISGAAGTGSGVGVSAGASSVSNGVVTFSNSNGVSFGLAAGILTATVNPGPAAGIAAGAVPGSSQTTGSLVFSNSNGFSFGLVTGAGAGTITGSYTVPQLVVSAGTTTGSETGLTFSNSNGVTFGLNAGTITASIAAVPIAISGSNGSFAFSTLSMGNLNGLSHYTSNGSLVASYTVPVQSNQTLGLFGVSQTTQNTSGTVNATGMSFAGAGNVSVGLTNGSVVISGATVAGLTTGGAYVGGNTTGQASSSTYPLSSFNVSGAGIISAGWSSNSLIISAPASTGITLLSAGMSTNGNTAGTTGIASNQLIFAGGANITLSGSTSLGSMTISIAGGAGGGGGGTASLFAVSNTTQSSSGSQAVSALSFNGAGGVSMGISNGSIIVSAPATSSLAATGNATISTNGATISFGANAAANSIGGNSTSAGAGYSNISSGTAVFMGGPNITLSQNGASVSISAAAAATGISGIIVSNTTYTSGTVSFSNANGISFGSSAGQAITASYTQSGQAISAQGGSSTFSTLNFTNSNNVSFSNTGGSIWGSYALNVSATGGTSNALSGLTFKDSQGVSFGLSTGVGVGTITASVAAQTNQTLSMAAISQSTGNTSGMSVDARSFSFGGYGGVSAGLSTSAGGSTVIISGPAISSLSATGGLSFSSNVSTISVGIIPVSRLMMPADHLTAITAPSNASISIQYVPVFVPVSGSRIDALIAMSGGSAATTATGAIVFSAYAAIYTRNGSTLSSLSSGSTQTTYTYASNTGGQTQLTASVIRPVSVPINFLMTQGEYFVAFNLVTNTSSIGLSTTNYGLTLSMMGANGLQSALPYAEITANTANSTNQYGGMGVYSAASTGLPPTLSLSGINQTGSALSAANIALVFRNV